MTLDPLPEEMPELPRLVTEVPGPASKGIRVRESAIYAAGGSAASVWSQLSIVDGRGCIVRDADGNFLLDACSGTVVMNIGHGHPRVKKKLVEQVERLTHFYDFAAEIRVEFLEALRATLDPRFEVFHMNNSGTEAVEAAIRIVRSATGRHEIISFHNGYHGRTFGALSLTPGVPREGMGPLLPGVFQVAKSAAGLAAASQVLTGPPAAVFIEPMQGAGGMYPLSTEFLQQIRDFCDRTGALLVYDEILTGAGRTGRMWCYEHSEVVPDLILMGKGLAAGFPIGIVGGPAQFMNKGPIASLTHNGSTFGGNQMACAAGLATLQVLEEEQLVENAAEIGAYLLGALQRAGRDYPNVGDVRGLGLAIGVELVETGTAQDAISADQIRDLYLKLLAQGVVVSSTSNVLRITPPLCLTHRQADFILTALCNALRVL
ncbi:MAG TPA: hypothetical protein DEP84_26785 [Chloroflexi bacterium]|nr:hypothetical protein [Chloroflexota bacterium]